MKSIYFCTNIDKIQAIYREFILDNSTIYTADSLGTTDFSEVEIIFSTWNMPILTKEQILQYFPSLKAVFYAAGTIKYFAQPYLELGIKVYNADQVNAIPVAEFAASEIVLANKGYYQAQNYYRFMRYGKSRKVAEAHVGNYKSKVGIIGAGKIGQMVIHLLKVYDCDIFVNDAVMTKEKADALGVTLTTLEEIFKECDVISNHLPDIPSTQNILNYDLFRTMKPFATFINTARGRQVDDKGLRKALKENSGRCAVLDVLRHEPILPFNPLFGMPNVFITPHIAGSLNQEECRMAKAMKDACDAFQNGKESLYEVKNYDLSKNA